MKNFTVTKGDVAQNIVAEKRPTVAALKAMGLDGYKVSAEIPPAPAPVLAAADQEVARRNALTRSEMMDELLAQIAELRARVAKLEGAA
jgi:hypothetical protein